MKINLSEGKDYYTQRNNKVRPLTTCNTTSMIMLLTYSGIQLPKLQPDEQPEDSLTNFLWTNPTVLDFYKQTSEESYLDWKAHPNTGIAPNEFHVVLAKGTNLWLGGRKNVVKFTTSATMKDILWDLICGKAVAMTGVFNKLRHVVCVVGFESLQDASTIKSASDVATTQVTSILIDDPYGDYRTAYKSTKGNDIPIPFAQFMSMMREFNKDVKWAHRVV